MTELQRQQQAARLRTVAVLRADSERQIHVGPEVLCKRELPAWHRWIQRTVIR